MKAMSKFLSTISFVICFAVFNSNVFAGSGNHITMSLQNCSQPTSNTIQFDLYAVSDGSPSSDLRANSFQCGINFNRGILQPGATIAVSSLKGSTEFPELNEFNFPAASSSDHLRIVQSVYSKANTGHSMKIGQSYRIGTFVLTSSANWVSGINPEFAMQTTTVAGKTVCAAVVWNGASAVTNGVTIPGGGTAAMNRVNPNGNSSGVALSASIGCRLGKNEISGGSSLNIFPNPTSEQVTVSFNSNTSADYHLTLLDAAGREVMVKDGKAVEGANAINVDLKSVAKGVYMINLLQGDNKMTEKVIVE